MECIFWKIRIRSETLNKLHVLVWKKWHHFSSNNLHNITTEQYIIFWHEKIPQSADQEHQIILPNFCEQFTSESIYFGKFTLLQLGTGTFRRIRSMPWLMMHWFLLSSGHQQTGYLFSRHEMFCDRKGTRLPNDIKCRYIDVYFNQHEMN